MISPGFTFLSRTPKSETEHLFIVISLPINGKVLIVNITSKKDNKDDKAILSSSPSTIKTSSAFLKLSEALTPSISLIKLMFL